MNSNVYFIVGAVAVILIICLLILLRTMKKRKQKQLKSFHSNHSNIPVTEKQKRLLAFGAILSYHRMEDILNIVPKNRLDQYVNGLKDQWDINSPEDAKTILNNLLSLKRSKEFEPVILQPSPELIKIQTEIAKGLDLDLSIVKQTTSAYAWDICRSVSLAKRCYWCGYLSEIETWGIIETAANTAIQYGKNWTDYTVSFLLGRTLQGFNPDDLIIECKQILHSQNPLLRKITDIDVYKQYPFA
ncbi:DUF1266 domain-containing protein [Polluticaenibacter yanchengensis]|uniref:DUF1266 domain-containing protein n=1 Tax=Polluticaenibacter yanchengensis TaxID=3014562 RepID=A0ABT4UNM8_9BACT|nr:DUF1266 domain-containing protein [Chitinophagaceae bacterium LY-5]